MPLLFRVSKTDEDTSYEFGGLTILFTALAAIGTFLSGSGAFENFRFESCHQSTLVALQRRLLIGSAKKRRGGLLAAVCISAEITSIHDSERLVGQNDGTA